ncbi:MAG: putative metal-binding motif-containing protein [Candidatus Woesearchaeota archaeon]
MKVDIKKQGLSNSISGYPQTQIAFIKSIPPNNKYTFQFTWQTTKNTEPGNYIITMTSTVPDSKCDQSTMIPVSKNFNVYIAESFDGCVARVDDFKLDTTNFVLNQPVLFSGKKLNSYQDWSVTGNNCESKGKLVSETFFDTNYNLKIINQSNNQIIATKTGMLPKNTQSNTPISFNVQWDSARAGRFIAELTITSTGSQISLCENRGITTTISTNFNIGNDNDNDKWFDIEGDCNDNNPNIYPTATELCDGIDNNCNSQIDEGCNCVSGLTKKCSELFFGECSIGNATCQNNQWQGCPLPINEICNNNKDDDCDSKTDCNDEDCLSFIENNRLVCQNKCVEGYADLDLNINNGCECKIETEICDGLDNNCDGLIDNEIKEEKLCKDVLNILISTANKNISQNNNVCFQKATCNNGNWICPNYEINETKCDNLDNDCDNLVDENLIISKNEKGICINNTQVCKNGNYVDSENNIKPTEEICDGLDNNCDGHIDEKCPCITGTTKQCGVSDIGVCKYGIQKCVNGQWGECENAIYPSEEICNDLDDNCNNVPEYFENFDCCSGEVEKRNCIKAECPKIHGYQECKNFKWQECNAICPENFEILKPKNNAVYETCDKTYKLKININYPNKEYCDYFLNNNLISNALTYLNLTLGNYKLEVDCQGIKKFSNFEIKNINCTEIKTSTDLITDLTLNKNDFYNAEKTPEVLNTSTKFNKEENITKISHIIEPKTFVENVSVYLEIPKCLANFTNELDFLTENYTIIKEDPIIAWHYKDLNERQEINYNVKKNIPQECLEQIKLLPIAKLIKNLPEVENPKKSSLLQTFILVLGVITIVIYINTHHNDQSHIEQTKVENIDNKKENK